MTQKNIKRHRVSQKKRPLQCNDLRKTYARIECQWDASDSFSLTANEAFDASPCALVGKTISAVVAQHGVAVVVENMTAGGQTTITHSSDGCGTVIALMELIIAEGDEVRFSSSSQVQLDLLATLLPLLPTPYGDHNPGTACMRVLGEHAQDLEKTATKIREAVPASVQRLFSDLPRDQVATS